jgi:uncharacterized protein (TIGR03663 family)
MHADEAVHAVKFRDLWERGVYRYDPNEFNGPTLYYAALPVVYLNGRRDFADTREADYRTAVALFGAGMVLLFALVADGIGRPAALCAAALTALSPASVFYSRYYIQEMLLAFFTLGALACGWRYARKPSAGWAAGAGLCAGLMIATKETAVLAFAAAALALPAAAPWGRPRVRDTPPLRGNGRDITLALVLALLIAALFLSGLLTNPGGAVDYLRAFTPWLDRAHGTDLHRHPWAYYLETLAWSHRRRGGPVFTESLILGLAVVGVVAAFVRRDVPPAGAKPAFVRFVALYTLVLTAIYSAIPYKTPWCVLTFLTGLILLAGVGAVTLVGLAPGKPAKAAVALLLAAGLGHLGWEAYRASYVYFSDSQNPYAYSPTAPEVIELARKVEALAQAHPAGERMVIKVFSSDGYYWPLPWYLRRFPNVGYWTGRLPDDPDAPIILASPEFDEELTRRLDATHLMTGYFGLRPGALMQLWVRLDLWKAYLAQRKALQGQEQAGFREQHAGS